ncbi:helix-turn-helix domain-containing protein [Hymenobacter antarcticus]|uniref:HTH cro/C1-type domain-containing protein n=1 Tax=Hymenobacter antarcticus TaxID=486270 RepID=A0ABP7PMI0_9BACT
MVERIRTLLETRQLTPTQFADLIGIARPIVSHILSGRNKPSLEVVQRILAALPELSMPWLLNGTGSMYGVSAGTPPSVPQKPEIKAVAVADEALGAASVTVLPAPAVVSPPVLPLPNREKQFNASLSAGSPASGRVGEGAGTPKRFTRKAVSPPSAPAGIITEPSQAAPVPTVQAQPSTQSQATSPVVPVGAPTPAAEASPALVANSESIATALFAGAEKPIRRIVIFYRDGSFADYQPE